MENSLDTLELSATPEGWRLFSMRKIDPDFVKFRDQIFQRDKYTCTYCGFKAKQFQEVINLDGNYRNNKMSNLVTVCCFCAQCCFLESVGKDDYGGGILIYLPELSQVNLNALCHVMFCSIQNDIGYSSTSQALYRSLRKRASVVESCLGEGMSDGAMFGGMLISSNKEYLDKAKEEIFPYIRLLPLYDKFGEQVKAWTTEMKGKKG